LVPLGSVLVKEAMNPAPETIDEGLSLKDLARHLSEGIAKNEAF